MKSLRNVIFLSGEQLVPNIPANIQQAKKEPSPTVPAVTKKKSDVPTIAMAPSDYEHIYHAAGAKPIQPSAKAKKEDSKKEVKVANKPASGLASIKHKSKSPTVALAPSDFEHIYHAGK